jgi:hypothetical protein
MSRLKKYPLIFGLFLLIIGSLGYRHYKFFILSQEQEGIFRKTEKIIKDQRELSSWYKEKSRVSNSNAGRPKIVIRIERD